MSTFGVAMLHYRRPSKACAALFSLLNQTRCPDLIVVVDNGPPPHLSSEDMWGYLLAYAQDLGVEIQYKVIEPVAVVPGRAEAIRLCDTDYCLSADDDMIYPFRFVERACKVLDIGKVFTGTIFLALVGNLTVSTKKFVSDIGSEIFDGGTICFRRSEIPAPYENLMDIPYALGEDPLLNADLISRGYDPIWLPRKFTVEQVHRYSPMHMRTVDTTHYGDAWYINTALLRERYGIGYNELANHYHGRQVEQIVRKKVGVKFPPHP